MELRLAASNIKKAFNRRIVFQGVSVSLSSGQSLLITGRNGSGKSTLVKILGGVLRPTEGVVTVHRQSKDITDSQKTLTGFVSPYMELYDEFTARENLQLALAIRGLPPDESGIDSLLSRVWLAERADDRVATFSSGMKQRLKYAFALVHHPSLLILDEPMSNLDADGMKMVHEVMDENRSERILIVATNDLRDMKRYDVQVNLNELP